MNAPDPGHDLRAMDLAQQLPGNGTSRHAADRFARRCPAAAAARLNAVFRLIGGIGVGGSKGNLHLLVILGSLIFVAHHHGNRCAQGHAIHDTAQDLHLIGFLARCGDFALAWFAPV